MEQVGYDQKADIWSFGITSLELANGRAPLASHPPMKVLLMTLQNDPPTLDRQNAKHKYSKSFKDMIDTCLQKDPSKRLIFLFVPSSGIRLTVWLRPTAERLLTHAFFKGAKRKQYLVDTLIKDIAPVTERPHKQPKSHHTAHAGPAHQSWDFSAMGADFLDEEPTGSAATSSAASPVLAHRAIREDEEPEVPAASPTSQRKKVVMLAEPEVHHVDVAAPATTEGKGPGSESKPGDGKAAETGPPKKGRFTVTSNEEPHQGGTPASSLPASTSSSQASLTQSTSEPSKSDVPAVNTGKTQATFASLPRNAAHQRTLSSDSLSAMGSPTFISSSSLASPKTPQTPNQRVQTSDSTGGGEVRKGRFSVIENAAQMAATSAATTAALQLQEAPSADVSPSLTSEAPSSSPMSSKESALPPVARQESAKPVGDAPAATGGEKSRKGRFEVTQDGSILSPSTAEQAAGVLSTSSSSVSALSSQPPLLPPSTLSLSSPSHALSSEAIDSPRGEDVAETGSTSRAGSAGKNKFGRRLSSWMTSLSRRGSKRDVSSNEALDHRPTSRQ